MASRSYVRGDDGEVTHIRETSDDGSQSRLYEYDGSVTGELLHDGRGARK